MARKSDWSIWDWMLLFGGVWMLTEIFKTAEQAGIGKLAKANRDLIPYRKDNKSVFDLELKKLTITEAGEVIRLIVEGRLAPVLQKPLYKNYPNEFIDAEFRSEKWRILAKKLDNGNFLMVSFFKKQSEQTPEHEKRKAEDRIREYLSRLGKR